MGKEYPGCEASVKKRRDEYLQSVMVYALPPSTLEPKKCKLELPGSLTTLWHEGSAPGRVTGLASFFTGGSRTSRARLSHE